MASLLSVGSGEAEVSPLAAAALTVVATALLSWLCACTGMVHKVMHAKASEAISFFFLIAY
jgi:hypothetical protein